MDKNEIQKIEPSPLMPIISAASTNGEVDADKLLKLLEANERYEKNEARKAYHIAMSAFQTESPNIIKTKEGHNCRYAGLSDIVAVISPILSKNGLSHSWVTSTKDGISVTCKITHIMGHSEETSLSAAPDKSGSKNDIQAVGSTITYLQRYTLKSALGLAEAGQDDDGAAASAVPPAVPKPNDQEQKIIDAICKKLPQIKGKKVNGLKVAAILFAAKGEYPSKGEQIGPASEYLVKKNKPEMYVNATKDEIEKQKADLAAVEEAERTARDKFGEETEEPEPVA